MIITTHSPYIVNYLTLAIKAYFVKSKIIRSINSEELLRKLGKVVPLASALDADTVNIYQVNDHGRILRLPDYEGIPSDSNYLNEFLANTNELYDELIEIEDLI